MPRAKFQVPPKAEDRYDRAAEAIRQTYRFYREGNCRAVYHNLATAREQMAAGRAFEMEALRDPMSASNTYIDLMDSINAMEMDFVDRCLPERRR